MKINGKKIDALHKDVLCIPRPSGDITFHAAAVISFDEFDKLVPVPKPPMTMYPGGKPPIPNFEHPEHLKAMESFGAKRANWLILQSLSVTPDLEWETVKMSDPSTWHLWDSELSAAGFNQIERLRIQGLALSVNSLNEEAVEMARKRFLAGRAAQEKQ